MYFTTLEGQAHSMYDFSGSYVHLVLPGLRSKVVDVGNILLL